jgi:hypothetical protein
LELDTSSHFAKRQKKIVADEANFKVEVYGNQLLDGYNRDVVLPLIIHKLNQRGYIYEHENGQISLTPIGMQHCGEDVVLDENLCCCLALSKGKVNWYY